MRVDVVTPQSLLLSIEADAVACPGLDGHFGILPGHMPFVSSLMPGTLTITASGRTHVFAIGQGFAEITPNSATILTEEALEKSKISVEETHKQLTLVEQQVETATRDANTPPAALAALVKQRAVLNARLAVATA